MFTTSFGFDHPGELVYNFAILYDLEQRVQHPTRIPDRHGDTQNTLNLFLTSNLLLMLSPFPLRWATLITISYLYLVLSLQSLLRILQSRDAFGVLPLLVRET